MPDFTQWTVPTPFTNVLFNPMAVDKAANEAQQARQQIGATNMEMVGRAAGSLLNMSPEAAAAAYPGMVANLQRNGFAMNAPPEYPGHDALQSIVNAGIPLQKQYEYGILTSPDVLKARQLASQPTPPDTGGSTGGGGTGGGGVGGTYAPGTPFTPKILPPGVSLNEDAMVRTIAGEAGGEPLQGQIAVAHVINNRAKGAGVTPRDVVFSPNQFEPWNGGAARARLEAMQPTDPAYQTILNNVVRPVLAGQAADPTNGATHFYAPVAQQALGRPPPSWGQGAPSAVIGGHNFYKLGYGPGQAQTATAPTAAPTVVPTPFNPNAGPRVAGASPAIAPGVAPVVTPQAGTATLPPANPTTGNPNAPVQIPPPSQAAATIPQSPTATRLNGTDVAGPPGVVPTAGAGAAAPSVILDASGKPLQAPPPAPNRMMAGVGLPGVTIGLPTNGMAPPAQTAAAPVATAVPPPAAPPPVAPAQAPTAAPQGGTGVNSPQYRQAQDLMRRAEILDSVKDPTGVNHAKAAAMREQAQLALKVDTFRDLGGGMQQNMLTNETMYKGPPRSGTTIDAGGNVWALPPGQKPYILAPTDPTAIAARKAAEAQGTQVGTASGKLPTELANQGAEANRAISTLDEGAHNIALAKQGGINAGYFAPWLTGVASIAKSIGGDEGTKLLGINPTAVGDIQTARKTLAIVSSSILKQALGDSQITDAKIEHFIHAQPGIETDPDALIRVMNWARSQFVYEREMAAQAMEDTSPETGTLPLNWKQKYYSKHGFGPIYNPEAAEMQQPDGRVPPREPPSTRAAPPETPITATGPGGHKLILKGGQWVPQ